jgi:hypothetical protein
LLQLPQWNFSPSCMCSCKHWHKVIDLLVYYVRWWSHSIVYFLSEPALRYTTPKQQQNSTWRLFHYDPAESEIS